MSEKIVQLNEEIIKGQQGLARHHQRAEQESICPHRGLAKPSLAGRALSVCLCGRHLPAPQLGRRVRKCSCFGGA